MLATVTRDSLRLWKPSASTPPTSATSSAPATAVANGNSASEFQLAAAVSSHQACVGAVPNDSIKHISWGTQDPSLLCVTTAASHEILIYNVAAGKSPKLVDRISPLDGQAGAHACIVAAYLLGPTNRLLLFATTSPTSASSSLVHIFDRDTRQLQESYALTPSSSQSSSSSPSPTLTTLAHSHDYPNHSLIAVGTSAGDIYLIDRTLGTGDSTSLLSPFTGPITALAFSPASHTLLTAGDAHGTVAYWHLAPTPSGHDTRQPTATFQSAHAGPVTGICPSPINKIALISCGRDGCVVLYDSSNAKRIRAFNYAAKYARDGFSCASFKSDGYSIALGVKGTGEVVVLDLRRPTVPVGVVGAGAGGEDVVGVGYAGPTVSASGRGGDKSGTSRATKEAYDKLVKGANAAGVSASVRTGRMQVQPGTVANPAPLPTTSAPVLSSSSARPRVTVDAAAFSPVRSSHQQPPPSSSPTSARPSSFTTSRATYSSPLKSPTGLRTATENESPLDTYTRTHQHRRGSASSPAPHRASTSARSPGYASPSRATAPTSTSRSPPRDTYQDARAGVANAHVYQMHPDDMQMHPSAAAAAAAADNDDNMDVDLAARHVPPAHSSSPPQPRHSPPIQASRPGPMSPPSPALVSAPAAHSSFSLALLHSAIDDAVAGLRDQLRADIQNVHLEVLRQFDQHRVEMAELVVQVAGVQELVAENRRLRAEVERLRGGVPTAASAGDARGGGTGRWSTMGEGGVGAGGWGGGANG